MEDNEPVEVFYGLPSPSRSSESSTDPDEEEEIPVDQQVPQIDENNSVTGDWSRSSQDRNGDHIYEPSEQCEGHPITPDSDGDNPLESLLGEASLSERLEEEIRTVEINYQGLHCIYGLDQSETATYLSTRAQAFLNELLLRMDRSPTDYPPPPGRLPVSITRELSWSTLQMKINLKNGTSSIVDGNDDIPLRFRNKGFPSMDVTADCIQRKLDLACEHLAFWVSRLVHVVNSVQAGDEVLDPVVFAEAFELFQREFLDFDDMVTFSLNRLRTRLEPDLFEPLEAGQQSLQNKYSLLEIAFLIGRLKGQESYISHVSEQIENVLGSIWSIYTTQ